MEKIHSKTKVAIRIIVTTLLVFALIPFGAMAAFAVGTDNGDGTWTITERIAFPETIGSAVFTADSGETVTITAATGYDSDDVETTSLSFGGNAVNNSFGDGTEYADVTMTVTGVTGQFVITATGDGSSLGSWTYGQDPPPDPVFTFSATPMTVELDNNVQSSTVTVVSTKDGDDLGWNASESLDWLDVATNGDVLTLSFVGEPEDGDQSGIVTLVQTESGEELAITVNYTAAVVVEPEYVLTADRTELTLSPPDATSDVVVFTTTKSIENVVVGNPSLTVDEDISPLPSWLKVEIVGGNLTASIDGTPPIVNQSATITVVQDESEKRLDIEVTYVAPVAKPDPVYVFSVDETDVALSQTVTSYDIALTSTVDGVPEKWSFADEDEEGNPILPDWLEVAINDNVLTWSLDNSLLPNSDQTAAIALIQTESGKELAITVNYTAAVVASEPEPTIYGVLKHFGKWVLGTSGKVTARIAANRDSFVQLTLNDEIITPKGNYAVAGGKTETVVTLSARFLNGLPVGNHEFVVRYRDGYSEPIRLNIKAAAEKIIPDTSTPRTALPKTGDDTIVAIVVAGLAVAVGCALIAVTSPKRRRKP